MNTNIIIIEDFYSNPDLVRNFALTQQFNITGNFLGSRTTSFLTEDVKGIIQRAITAPGGNITEWFPQDGFSGSFQLDTAGTHCPVHDDAFNTWAGVCYLTPNAPISSGIGIYQHKASGHYSAATDCHYEYLDRTKWNLVDRIGNKYNRLVLYKSTMFHADLDYFGSNAQNGKLSQLFFFNTEF